MGLSPGNPPRTVIKILTSDARLQVSKSPRHPVGAGDPCMRAQNSPTRSPHFTKHGSFGPSDLNVSEEFSGAAVAIYNALSFPKTPSHTRN